MSFRTFTTVAIDCDGPGVGEECFEAFADTAPLSEIVTESLAVARGWSKTHDGKHLCPYCRKLPICPLCGQRCNEPAGTHLACANEEQHRADMLSSPEEGAP